MLLRLIEKFQQAGLGESSHSARPAVVLIACCWAAWSTGCEEEKPVPTKPQPAEAPAPAPKVESPPRLSIDAGGPSVRGMTAVLEQPNGSLSDLGVSKLKQYLIDEKKFIESHEVKVTVDRQAKPSQVALFLNELGVLSPSRVVVVTDTRPSFSKELTFVPESQLESPPECSLLGTITEDRGTAIWRLSGGAARKRPRGMGGPDLSMTAETIESMTKSCDSDLFFVTAPPDVEWGLVYDLAASGVALEDASLDRAVIPSKPQTMGRPVEL